ncbi:MFS transporter [Ralstonia flatus]|uniref:Bicyclomycin resistance protein n=1 Tax=Ralstonia flatus TaxID=3058601 RepID=A0AAD2F672_9RALS|nr:MFS transporter [Ralstonia sp. LMG 32965]MBN6210064.1 MFS transporter [Ralstonia pickettii]CAJ0885794.1 Bicyclomycin resistance protein [Ralstonia sp. LMG 32965]CAJ0890383.1 Bicyclomycin resistance protein [Ralstonia sp. LMG 32965]
MTRRPLSFALLLPLLLSAQPVATDSYLPTLPAIAQTLGSASTSLTVFALAFGIGQLPMGSLADRFGRRQVLLIGLACYAAAALAGALATTAFMLTAARALQGFSMAAILVCARAAVRDLHPAREGPHVLARGLTGLGFVALVAPVLGAFVAQHAGWRWVLAGMSLYAIVLWAMCWYGFAETRQETGTETGGVREIFSSADFRAWGLLAASTYAGIFCFLLLSPMVYIAYLGLSPELYGWIPAGGSLVYILSTTGCRRLLRRQSLVLTVQQGATLSLIGAGIQGLGCWVLPGHAWPLLLGHAVYCMGHGIHQPCGQAGAVGELPHLAGRAVSWSGFIMMLAAFCLGQTAAAFDDTSHSLGAWPMVAPMMLAGGALVAIAFLWLPKLQHRANPQRAAA